MEEEEVVVVVVMVVVERMRMKEGVARSWMVEAPMGLARGDKAGIVCDSVRRVIALEVV